jgi:hypothetical protein
MDVYKLRMKLGDAELEVEGAQEWVEKQRDIFLERTVESPSTENSKDEHRQSPAKDSQLPERAPTLPLTEAQMNKIASLQDDVVTLTAVPGGETADEDSLMLLLLAHKVMRNTDSVLAGDLLAGMKQSGRPVDRLDGVFAKIDNTLVIRSGVRRGTKYRLTNPGAAKAKAVAGQLLATVA